jgi:hypothetical protein
MFMLDLPSYVKPEGLISAMYDEFQAKQRETTKDYSIQRRKTRRENIDSI